MNPPITPDASASGVQPTLIRQKLGLSQKQFAELLGVSKKTLQNWEQGVRKPSGAAQALLKLTAEKPDVVREVLL